jgi:hypothetical protein
MLLTNLLRRPHGDFSDYASFFCLGTGIASMAAPDLYFQGVGPMKPFFDTPATTEATTLIRFLGGFLVFMGLVLFVNRWNTISGKAGGLGCLVAAINSAHIAWTMDGGVFVPRGWYVFAGIFFLTFIHLSFFANPMHTSASLAAKEKEKAKKGK